MTQGEHLHACNIGTVTVMVVGAKRMEWISNGDMRRIQYK